MARSRVVASGTQFVVPRAVSAPPRSPRRAARLAGPDVSVIIACYNGAETLAETLDSLVAQHWDRPWEIILADNGSTDASLAIFAEHAARHPETRMRLVDASARHGKPHALNLAIRAAAGRSLVFCDADDTVAPGWLAAMGKALGAHDFVAARYDLTALNPDWVSATRQEAQTRLLGILPFAPFCLVAGGATLGFRKELFEVVGDFDPAFTADEDTDFCIRAHLKGYRLRFVPDAVYNYRFRASPEAIYRQAYNYARSEALLRRRHLTDAAFLTPRPWLQWSARLARLLAAQLRNRLLRRRQSLLQQARFHRALGMAMGDLAGSLAFRVAPRIRRAGDGLAMLQEARRRWIANQEQSPTGPFRNEGGPLDEQAPQVLSGFHSSGM